MKALSGKVCLVTGATAGIGLVAAEALAIQDATVVIVGRNPQKCEQTVNAIKAKSGNSNVSYLVGDLSLLRQVEQVADQFKARFDRLDVLLNNAGAVVMDRQVTAEGYEMTFALNHLSYFYLTHLLQELLLRSAPARIINVSSDAHRGGKLNFDDLMGEKSYSGFGAYSNSKLANVLFTYELARRLEDTGVTANALHPGLVATNFGKNNGGIMKLLMPLVQFFALTPVKGAETSIYLATAPEVAEVTGKYFAKKQAVQSAPASYDVATQKRLWQVSEELVQKVIAP